MERELALHPPDSEPSSNDPDSDPESEQGVKIKVRYEIKQKKTSQKKILQQRREVKL